MSTKQIRCDWAGSDARMLAYHDEEWGVPLHDDRGLFEFLALEGAQAGLSWKTILNKREGYRRALRPIRSGASRPLRPPSHRDAARKSGHRAQSLEGRKHDQQRKGSARSAKGVRKLRSIHLELRRTESRRKIAGAGSATSQPVTPESDAMSKALKQRGFRFVGTTICYAFMQATGMVNDHIVACYRTQRLVCRPRSRRVLPSTMRLR